MTEQAEVKQQQEKISPQELEKFQKQINQRANATAHQQIKERKFLGKMSDFIDKDERNFETAHLKAYLDGKEYFNFGYNTAPNGRRYRMEHKVKFEYVKK